MLILNFINKHKWIKKGKIMSTEQLVGQTDEAHFDEQVLKSSTPTLVDFWAPWCGPCKMIAPILDEIAPDFSGKVNFVKVNVDDNPNLAAKYGIRGIPSLLIIKNGEVADAHVGGVSQEQLKDFINKNI
jgi:thioredoxin 1